jgi:hypothetical protein
VIQDLAAAALESWKEAEQQAAECEPGSERMNELLDAAAQARALYADLTSWALADFQATRHTADRRAMPRGKTIEIRPWPTPDNE